MTDETYLRSIPPPCRARDSPRWHVQRAPHTHCCMSLRHVRTLAMTCYSLSGIKRNYDKIDIIVLCVTVTFLNNVTHLTYIHTDRPDILTELAVTSISTDTPDNYLHWQTWHNNSPSSLIYFHWQTGHFDTPDSYLFLHQHTWHFDPPSSYLYLHQHTWHCWEWPLSDIITHIAVTFICYLWLTWQCPR